VLGEAVISGTNRPGISLVPTSASGDGGRGDRPPPGASSAPPADVLDRVSIAIVRPSSGVID
jgi:hypothetical protein